MPYFLTEATVLVFGGPYSNLSATRALRAEAERRQIPPSRVICTGDVVAYCAEPDETVCEIRDWGITVVAGNCEEQLATGAADCGCGFEAGSRCEVLSRTWYDFARTRISADNIAWMAGRPARFDLKIKDAHITVVHGGFKANNRFIFSSDVQAITEELSRTDADIVVAGHSGIPFARQIDRQTWFNPGVIGVPANDGTADTWYGLISLASDGSLRLTTHRLRYDARAAARAMQATNPNDPYADTLTSGLWPGLDVLPPLERAQTGRQLHAIDVIPDLSLRPTEPPGPRPQAAFMSSPFKPLAINARVSSTP